MLNEYGAKLDRNGYAPSILMGNSEFCSLCYRTDRPLQRHEVFGGPFRQKSKKYGLWLSICDECHRNVHKNGDVDRRLKKEAQRHAMLVYGWTEADFIRKFGKNYV